MGKRALAEKNKKVKEEPLPGITGITVKGFKSIVEETKIEIRPLTLLAGANSSGKSSIMQPLLLLKQTLDAPYDPGPLLLDGSNVKFSSYDQMASRRSDGRFAECFSITLHRIEDNLGFTFNEENHGSVALQSMDESAGGLNSHWRAGMTVPEIAEAFHWDTSNLSEEIVGVGRTRFLFHLERRIGGPIFPMRRGYIEHIDGCIHVPGLRRNPNRIYLTSGTGPRFPGTFDNYVAAMILEWQEKDDPCLGGVDNALTSLGLARKVRARRLDAAHIELLVSRLPPASKPGKEDMVNIADVGLGVTQVLPVLVSLFPFIPGRLLYLEEPEIHLHPRAQVGLASVLADAAKRGVRVVAETHSSLLLLAVQTLVAKGELDPDLVKLHWFQRGEDGVTKVHSADLDEKGAFGDWPEDFADVELGAEGRYLDAVQSRRDGD